MPILFQIVDITICIFNDELDHAVLKLRWEYTTRESRVIYLLFEG